MSKKSLIADRSFLSKPVPRSTKYSHIEPTIDTGASTLNHIRKLRDNFVEHKYLEDELFVRIKPILLGRLIYETHIEVDLAAMDDIIVNRLMAPSINESTTTTTPIFASPSSTPTMMISSPRNIYSRNQPHPLHHVDSVGALLADRTHGPVRGDVSDYPPSVTLNDSPTLSSNVNRNSIFNNTHCLLRSPGLHSQRINGSADSGYDYRVPYLLLDIREAIDWSQCHIVGALPYPHTFIKRDQMSRDLIVYRNKTDKIIILYDNDESKAVPAAQTLCERGFNNVYVLSGGINHLVKRISGILIGEPPVLKRNNTNNDSLLPQLNGLKTGSITSIKKRSNIINTSSLSSRSSSSLSLSSSKSNNTKNIPPQTGIFNMHDLEQSLDCYCGGNNSNFTTTPSSTVCNSRASSRLSHVSSTSSSSSSSSSFRTNQQSSTGGLVSASSPLGLRKNIHSQPPRLTTVSRLSQRNSLN